VYIDTFKVKLYNFSPLKKHFLHRKTAKRRKDANAKNAKNLCGLAVSPQSRKENHFPILRFALLRRFCALAV